MKADLTEQLKHLEETARALETGPADRAILIKDVIRLGEKILDTLPDAPGYIPAPDEGAALYGSPISDEPADLDAVLGLLDQNVLRQGMNKLARGDLSYIPNGGLYISALGDYLAAVSNRYVGVYHGAPGAVKMERMLLDWLGQVVGYPDTTAGDLTSGGSIANLVAVVTAREAHQLKAADVERAVVYLTPQTHHSVGKALRIAGLKECVQRYIPLDARYRMRADALEDAIQQDQRAGLSPWLVVASAGTTDVGAVDPLAAIADIAQRHQLWFHVDGAYGAVFALCEPGKKVLNGIEKSDSVVIDPHKGLFIPFGTGAVLVRDGRTLYEAHYYDASYLQDRAYLASDEVAPADLSPELTRHFRSLRLWLPLKLLGVAPFRAALEEKMLLARYFHAALQRIDGIEVGPAPDLSIVTFRYRPKRGEANAFNQKLVQAIQNDGRVFFSSTMLDGNFTIRLAALSFRTHLAQVETAIEVIQEKVRVLEDPA